MKIIEKDLEKDISKSPTKIFIINSSLSVVMLLIVTLSLIFIHYPKSISFQMVLRKQISNDGTTFFVGKMNLSSNEEKLKKGMPVKISFSKYPLNKYASIKGVLTTINKKDDKIFIGLITMPQSKKHLELLNKIRKDEYLVADVEVLIQDLRLYQKIFRTY